MKLFAPSYYADFRCIADRCQHNCCIGWDVVVDDDTAARYREEHGTFGQRLRDSLETDADGDTIFAMRHDGRCPFLNDSGLCDIIATLGEQALCQICDDHPRFRHTFSDRVEIGLGLCCEAAAELILNQRDPMALITLENDSTLPTAEETAFFKARDAVFAIAADRTRTIKEREHALLLHVGADTMSPLPEEWLSWYLPLERLDEDWTRTLLRLHLPPSDRMPSDDALEQLLSYFLFRHTADALIDGQFAARVAFAVHATRMLTALYCRSANDSLAQLARQYSAEIEYSDENPAVLLSKLL